MIRPHGVLIAEDDEVMRASLAELISSDPALRVVGSAADGIEAVRLAASLRPELVLMDVRMPRLDGIEATRQILAAAPTTGVVVLTTFDLDEYVLGALRAGAAGFLLKSTPVREVLAALHTVAEGQAMLAPEVTRRLISHLVDSAGPALAGGGDRLGDPLWNALTARERDVVAAVLRGRSNVELAAELHLSAATVKSYLSRLFDKVGVRDRTQLVIHAYESGWVDRFSQG